MIAMIKNAEDVMSIFEYGFIRITSKKASANANPNIQRIK